MPQLDMNAWMPMIIYTWPTFLILALEKIKPHAWPNSLKPVPTLHHPQNQWFWLW